MRRIAVLVFVALPVLVACSTRTAPATPEPARNLAAEQFALEDGDARLEGSGFLRQRGGDVVSCAGSSVWLMPSTPFFRWASEHPRGTIAGVLSRPDVIEYVREATCDVEGRFEFVDLPDGTYLAGTIVTWEVPGGPPLYISSTQGGTVFAGVIVDSEGPNTVTLTR